MVKTSHVLATLNSNNSVVYAQKHKVWVLVFLVRTSENFETKIEQPSASCNSASGLSRHLRVIVLAILQTGMKLLYIIDQWNSPVTHDIAKNRQLLHI